VVPAPVTVVEAPAQPAQPFPPPDASPVPVKLEAAGPATEPKTAVQTAEPQAPDSPPLAPLAPERAAPRGKDKIRPTPSGKPDRKR
jgi:hypothetical protein